MPLKRYKGRNSVSYSRRSKSRKPSPKKKSYAKRKTMTRKRVVNIASTKKMDTMSTVSIRPDGSAFREPFVMNGDTTYIIPWVATWRNFQTSSTNTVKGLKADPTRSATSCYMRRLKEQIQLATNDGQCWQWRRICFTMKGDDIYAAAGPSFRVAFQNSGGYQRLFSDWNNTKGGTTPPINFLVDPIFKGTAGTDWDDPFVAPLDPYRIGVKYDKTRYIRSGNNFGMLKMVKLWHPMNKTLIYNDDENGGVTDAAATSVRTHGMGDYYVIDMFRAATGAVAGSQLNIRSSG
ncbi:capsid protein [Pteropus associated gemycircularvirus 9]|uniref:Capsid protein n=1 Tax=Pteropus associated gemycircularvirus 9 TaxID=1985403 RepID=A0A140CTL7_9VIRU|nr:capsid protein [Pteropus associated gemycircularvirus 9]AMH87674.1 capsid protein [Pteropus associated gemycircularvirus 9]